MTEQPTVFEATMRALRRIEACQSSEERIAMEEQLARDVEANEQELSALRPDANLFSAIRAIVAFNEGVFLLKEGDRIVVGVPVETICYAKLGDGCDEREAVRAAYRQMMEVPPCDRERVTHQ